MSIFELLQVSPKMLVVKERNLGVPMDVGLFSSTVLEAGASWQTVHGSVRRGNIWPRIFCSNQSNLPNPSQSHRLPRLQMRLSSLTFFSPLPLLVHSSV